MTGALTTLALAVAVVPFGFGGGLVLALLKSSHRRLVRALCDAFTTFFRGIPDLLALFLIYFGLQALIDKLSHLFGDAVHIEVNAFVAGVIALSVVVAAYSSEVWIASLKAIPSGQIEAAHALGLERRRVFLLVVLPQLGRVALPGLGNIWTILVKDTSLVSTLALMDLLRAASEASKATTRPILFYSVAAAVYLVVSIGSALVQGYLEKRANRGYA
ncbi:MAG TPA: ABC transporter permease subunit [Aliidongia sp.]|uniref:ABC transporter permease n=1 Tax=Aliidongia sp. TaxID=1914230 RepID=UPI002DDCBBA8|nr:ABC transporter permease subunit [Aliidongia sp.]HEV2677589.1 ABC transporter permease subunit [Aliidongia sp.]